MAAITFPRDQIFRGWTEGETSRVVEKKDLSSGDLDKRIAQYHTSEAQEPYFYSAKLVYPEDLASANRVSKKTQRLVLIMLASVAISVIVYLATRSYFENAWKTCQSIADNKEYVITSLNWGERPLDYLRLAGEKTSWPYSFDRYATADDIWYMHPTAGASGWLSLRNVFCFLIPLGGFLGWTSLDDDPYVVATSDLVVDRLKDKRVCPPDFDIQRDRDPLTQEPISIQKLHSPQMIYLPNYVTDAKSFVSALLIAGKTDFLDPASQGEFTEEERNQILSQIERIFLVSQDTFN